MHTNVVALHVIITAGGRLPAELQALSDSPVKALLELGGRSLLTAAMAAAREALELDAVAVVGAPELRERIPADIAHIQEGQSVVDNIQRGFEHLGGEGHEYLILSPDLPFVTAAALSAFVSQARGAGAAFAAPLVSREVFLAQYPGAPNSFNRLDGGLVTMGSALFMEGRLLKSNLPLMHDFYAHRKWPHRLATLIGWPIALALLTGRLRLSAIEQRLERLTGGPARGVSLSDASIAYDIDDKANYDYALEHLRRQANLSIG
ncbi:nucleotidyltransferase family protein [bacterium]|nr:nucleotidyltransferase family protein [bacterium]